MGIASCKDIAKLATSYQHSKKPTETVFAALDSIKVVLALCAPVVATCSTKFTLKESARNWSPLCQTCMCPDDKQIKEYSRVESPLQRAKINGIHQARRRINKIIGTIWGSCVQTLKNIQTHSQSTLIQKRGIGGIQHSACAILYIQGANTPHWSKHWLVCQVFESAGQKFNFCSFPLKTQGNQSTGLLLVGHCSLVFNKGDNFVLGNSPSMPCFLSLMLCCLFQKEA